MTGVNNVEHDLKMATFLLTRLDINEILVYI